MDMRFAVPSAAVPWSKAAGDAMKRVRVGVALGGFIVGFCVGGALHVRLLFELALAALARSNVSAWLFTTKSVGEQLLVLGLLYLYSAALVLLAVLGIGVVWFFRTLGRWRRGESLRPFGPTIAAVLSLLAGLSLGAAGSATFNLRSIADTYADSLAYEDHYAVATVSALPEMRTLTFVYLAVCLTFFCATVAIGIYRASRSGNPRPH